MVHTFQFDGEFIALDVESGSVHILNELAFDAINSIENNQHRDTLLTKYSQSDIDEIFEEIYELKRQEVLFTECEHEPKDLLAFDPVVKALCLNITTGCNLRCKYCFASAGKVKHEDMSFEVAKKSIDFLVENSGTRRNLEVDFFGGEPTINFEVVKQTVEYAKTLEEKYNKNFRFTLTTNCYSITDDMIEYMNEEMKNVVISIDGRKSVHDSIRKTVAGKGSYDRVLSNAKKIVNARGDKEYYVRGTFTNNNLDFSNDIKAMYEQGFKEVSIEPVVTDSDCALQKEDLPVIFEHYDELARYLLDKRVSKGYNFFHFNIDFSGGPCLNKRLRGCGAGVEYFAVNPDGTIYPCHQFAGKEDFILGNVFSGIDNADLVSKFNDCNIYTKDKCESCFAKYYCSGGCIANSYNANNDFNVPYDLECEMMRKRVELSTYLSAKESEND